MTQSANARPCNCDQALKAEERAEKAERKVDLLENENDNLTLLGVNRAKRLATVSRILCDLVSAPSLSVAQFADPTLERIRLAMLGREG